ncbi:MAG TPA: DUF4404 family protein [Pirellulales bacterium]
MDQSPEELRARLADLHQQLQGTRSVSGDTRQLLLDILTDIDRVLADTDQSPTGQSLAAGEPAGVETSQPAGSESTPPLAQRLGEAARQFEDTHPQLAANVGSVVTALSRLGI